MGMKPSAERMQIVDKEHVAYSEMLVGHETVLRLLERRVGELADQPCRQAYMIDAAAHYQSAAPDPPEETAEYQTYHRLNALVVKDLALQAAPDTQRIAAVLPHTNLAERWGLLAEMATMPHLRPRREFNVHLNAWWTAAAHETEALLARNGNAAATVQVARLNAGLTLFARDPMQTQQFESDHMRATVHDVFSLYSDAVALNRGAAEGMSILTTLHRALENNRVRLGIWPAGDCATQALCQAMMRGPFSIALQRTLSFDSEAMGDDDVLFRAAAEALARGETTIDESVPIQPAALWQPWAAVLRQLMPEVWHRMVLTTHHSHFANRVPIEYLAEAQVPDLPQQLHYAYEQRCAKQPDDPETFWLALSNARLPEEQVYDPGKDEVLETLFLLVESLDIALGAYSKHCFVGHDPPDHIKEILAHIDTRLRDFPRLSDDDRHWQDAATELQIFLGLFEMLLDYHITDGNRLKNLILLAEPRQHCLDNRPSQAALAEALRPRFSAVQHLGSQYGSDHRHDVIISEFL